MAIGGATAAVAVGAWAAVALAAPTGLAVTPAVSHLPAHLTWGESTAPATGYDIQRAPGSCGGTFVDTPSVGLQTTSGDDTPPSNGMWCYHVVGHYDNGMGGDAPATSANVSFLYDTAAPTVSFSSPLNNTYVRGQVPVVVNSGDGAGSGVTGVSVSLDGGAAPPANWNTAGLDGPHTLSATATDAAGNQATATVSFTVDNVPPDAPAVSAPSTVAGSPTLAWPAASGASSYTVSRDGSPLGAVGSPWTDSGNPAPGSHTYVVTSVDLAGNTRASAPVTVVVVAASATQPRSLSASSPTNAVPHLTWQKPSTFAVTSWQVKRDGAVAATIADPDTTTFDDAGVGTQGSHTYTVQAFSGGTGGDVSSPITVTYDTVAPALGALAGAGGPDGSVSLTWPAASDPDPGSGVASYVVRRAGAAPAEVSAGTAICTVTPPGGTGCVDSAALSGTTYGYSVFAIDGAGNMARQVVTVKPVDSLPPDAVTGFRDSVGPTNAHLIWDVPARTGRNADLAGFRIIRLADGVKSPTNPKDGSAVCPGLGSKDGDCFIQNLATGKKVTFAIYAADEVPNYSAPALLTLTPKGDGKKPGRATKVRLTRIGGRLTLRWVSPKDRDLSHFVVNLNRNGPAKNPGVRPIVFKGRKLTASFTLKAKQVAYVNLFSVDLTGNYSRVTRLIVMPDKLVVAKAKKKKVVKKTTTPPKKTTTPPKKTGATSTTVPTKTTTPPTTVVVVTS